nr:hypothetical protein [Shewanella algae]
MINNVFIVTSAKNTSKANKTMTGTEWNAPLIKLSDHLCVFSIDAECGSSHKQLLTRTYIAATIVDVLSSRLCEVTAALHHSLVLQRELI